MDALDTYISDLRDRLSRTALSDRGLAERSKADPDGGKFTTRWLYGFRNGEMSNPQVKTLRALDRVLRSAESEDCVA
jgi:hypothetical protein